MKKCFLLRIGIFRGLFKGGKTKRINMWLA